MTDKQIHANKLYMEALERSLKEPEPSTAVVTEVLHLLCKIYAELVDPKKEL